ncbi:invasion associated locus B family protein [Saccharibacter floricola]|nr:invasion associated locus B family protein [Saccharibacter floricola]
MRYVPAIFCVLALSVFSAHSAPSAQPVTAPQESPTTLSGTSSEWQYRYAFSANHYKDHAVMMVMEQSLMAQDDQKKPFPLGAVLLARMTGNVGKMPLQQRPWRLTIMAPLNMSLLRPARVSFDQGAVVVLPWQMCTEKGCLASLDLTSQQVDQIRRAKVGRIMVDKVVGGVLTISFSANGAAGALSSLEGWMMHPPAR